MDSENTKVEFSKSEDGKLVVTKTVQIDPVVKTAAFSRQFLEDQLVNIANARQAMNDKYDEEEAEIKSYLDQADSLKISIIAEPAEIMPAEEIKG